MESHRRAPVRTVQAVGPRRCSRPHPCPWLLLAKIYAADLRSHPDLGALHWAPSRMDDYG